MAKIDNKMSGFGTNKDSIYFTTSQIKTKSIGRTCQDCGHRLSIYNKEESCHICIRRKVMDGTFIQELKRREYTKE